MLKYVFAVRKKRTVSSYEFRQKWEDEYFKEIFHKVINSLGGFQITMSLVLDIDYNHEMSKSTGEEIYDGMIEYLLPNASSIEEKVKTKEFIANSKKLEEVQQSFIDMERSTRFFVFDN